METPTPSLREQGVQALREGNLDGAIDLLARAVMADGQDAEAQAFLGVAYSQKGLHGQAKRALETATALRPQEPRFHFNMGVALEAAGDAQGAAAAYQETLRLNPTHPQARARLQGVGSAAARPVAPPAAATPAPGAPSPYGQPDASAAAPPWAAGQQPSAGAAPVAPDAPEAPDAPWLAGQQPAAGGPPGTVQCQTCKMWSRPGPSCEWCNALLKPARAEVPSPSMPGGYAAETGGYRYEEDSFDVMQAVRDWYQVIVAPRQFFADQEGRDGLKAPLAFLLAYVLLTLLSGLPIFLKLGPMALIAGPIALVFLLLFSYPATIIMMFIWAGIVHGICKIFGGQAGYIGTFRMVTYASAPWVILGLIGSIVAAATMPTMPGLGSGRTGQALPAPPEVRYQLSTADARSDRAESATVQLAQYGRPGLPNSPYGSPGGAPMSAPNPMAALMSSGVSLLLNLIGVIYYLCLVGVGAYHVHRVGSGAAVGIAVVSALVVIALAVLFFMMIGMFIMAMFAGMNAPGS